MRATLISFLLLTNLISFSQQTENSVVYHRMTRAGLSFAPSYMLNHGYGNIYLSGDVEYYIHPKISLVGIGYLWINTTRKESLENDILNSPNGVVLKRNHNLFAGMHYHFLIDKMLDPYVGVQPGGAFYKLNSAVDFSNGLLPSFFRRDVSGFSPVVAFDAGFNVYAVKYFHLFVNGRYVFGRHLGGNEPFRLNEISIQFGMGLNFHFFSHLKQ